MLLTGTALEKAGPGPKPHKLADGHGLCSEVTPVGGKWWRLKHRISGKEKRISLGGCADVGIKAADAVRTLLSQGLDLSAASSARQAKTQAVQWVAIEREKSGLPAEKAALRPSPEVVCYAKEEWADK